MRSRPTCAGVCAVVVAVLAPARAFTQCDPNWQTAIGVSGANSTVWCALAVDEASAVGPAVYAGGQFSTIGGTSAARIARWDGAAWSALGAGASDAVYALAAKDGFLYAGGGFASMDGQPSTRGIAMWDGSSWSTVGGGMSEHNSGIRELAFLGSDLYAGGYQNELGGVTLHKLGRWDGTSWSALPGDPLGTTDSVAALGVFDDGGGADLYVGGTFTAAGGDSNCRNIFRWDGTGVTALGRGTNDVVEALAVWNGSLYVGGHFTRVYQSDGTEVIANKIARWDGSQWYAVGTGMNSGSGYHVWTLNVFDRGDGDALYAGGSFTTADGITIRYLATWNGSNWGAVAASNFNGYVYALTTSHYDGGLYVGGTFTTSGTPAANRIVRWAGPRPVSPLNAAADPAEIPAGESSTLTASVSGAAIYWYVDGCGATFVGTGDTLVVSPTETTTYYARAFNGTCFSASCDSATATVNCATPLITEQPVGGVICTGHSLPLCVVAQGSGTLHYQWKRGGLSLIGATASCYTATQAGSYTCIVTDDCSPRPSDVAEVYLASPQAGDFDGDGQADFDDFAFLAACFAGPDQGVPSGCECVDVVPDGQIDLVDFAAFQTLFTN